MSPIVSDTELFFFGCEYTFNFQINIYFSFERNDQIPVRFASVTGEARWAFDSCKTLDTLFEVHYFLVNLVVDS